MESSPSDRCIVLPFRPAHQGAFDGRGLALHFLVGNVLVLHTGLKEMWFGWRATKIFHRPEALQRYCRGTGECLDLVEISRAQKIRFWITGRCTETTATLHLFDAEATGSPLSSTDIAISSGDRLVDFRVRLIQWLGTGVHPMPPAQAEAALWPETVDRIGLDAVGRALEALYLYAYGSEAPLDLAPFEKAAAMAPEAFMAQDLHGWAFYRNRDYTSAKIAFLKSLRINPAGAGAMSGLMWCGVYGKDLEEAVYWSARKADVCGRDVSAAREKGRRRYEKVNGS
jgi:hypothetical protein